MSEESSSLWQIDQVLTSPSVHFEAGNLPSLYSLDITVLEGSSSDPVSVKIFKVNNHRKNKSNMLLRLMIYFDKDRSDSDGIE